MPKGRIFTFDEQAEFVRRWQTASSVGEVGRAIGEMDGGALSQRALMLRKLGVPLKHFRNATRRDDRRQLGAEEMEQLAEIARVWAPKEGA